ncbi:unnamed protein product [Echinostoma caproni]|uniref:non-specific serine/threonine protein kinase n=1 Tax=Echinostoma caproni TaxID=27848 RepID=A0A183AAA1_9TREM|nr:unnamed protein product [Echinostoma caproni]
MKLQFESLDMAGMGAWDCGWSPHPYCVVKAASSLLGTPIQVMPNSDQSELNIRGYEFLKAIGKGSYGEVWLCQQSKDDKQVSCTNNLVEIVKYVVKKIDITQTGHAERKAALLECKLLSELKHPNIVPYKESFIQSGFLYIAMGYCEGGDLSTRLKLQNGRLLAERCLVEWFIQIAIALQHMHSRNILHRDLKTQNIFLTRNDIIKVGDLGIARVLDSASAMATTMIGTPYYMSPELFANKPYNHKSDIWALGCVLYEMSTLKHAFNARSFNALSYKILSGKIPEMPNCYSPELLDIVRAMLHQKPEKRPSARRVLGNPFIRKHIVLFLESTKDKSSTIGDLSLGITERSSICSAEQPEFVPEFKAIVVHESREVIRKPPLPDKYGKKTPHSPTASLVVDAKQTIHPTSAKDRISPSIPIEDALDSRNEPNIPSAAEQPLYSVGRTEVKWALMDARQRRRERRRLSEKGGQRSEEMESSEIVRRIILRQRNNSASDKHKIQTELDTPQRPSSHPDHLLTSSTAHSTSSSRLPGSTAQHVSLSAGLANNLDLLSGHAVSCISDPLPRTRSVACSRILRSPDMGYVSSTTSSSPSLLERLDQITSTPSSSSVPSSESRDLSHRSFGGSSDSGLSLMESSSVTSSDSKKRLSFLGSGQDLLRVPPSIREEREMAHVTTCMVETLRLGDTPESAVRLLSPACNLKSTSPLGVELCPFPGLSTPDVEKSTPIRMEHSVKSLNPLDQSETCDSVKGPTEPHDETISRTTRLKDRFANLHKECLRDVGLSKLHRVYDVLDQDLPSEQQERLLSVDNVGGQELSFTVPNLKSFTANYDKLQLCFMRQEKNVY